MRERREALLLFESVCEWCVSLHWSADVFLPELFNDSNDVPHTLFNAVAAAHEAALGTSALDASCTMCGVDSIELNVP